MANILTPSLDWVESCRTRLPNFLRKIASGQTEPVVIVGYGTSLTALGGGGKCDPFTPDGPYRNRIQYFQRFAKIAERIEVYDCEDGAGAVHVRVGINWSFKAAIEKKTGAPVSYLNMGISGTSAGDGLSPNGDRNGGDLERLEAVKRLGGDLVIIEYCMNDLRSLDLCDRLKRMIAALRQPGTDLLVLGAMGVPDPRKLASRIRTEDAARRAAEESDVAFVPFAPLFDDDGNMIKPRIKRAELCLANRINHPGPTEFTAYGKWLANVQP